MQNKVGGSAMMFSFALHQHTPSYWGKSARWIMGHMKQSTILAVLCFVFYCHTHTHPNLWTRVCFLLSLTHTPPFNGPFSGTTRWASTRKVKPIWILLKQETVSGSGISWAICKSAPRSRQITTPAPLVENWRILLKWTFTACMSLLVAIFFYTASKKQKKNKCLKCFDDVGWAAGRTSGL